MTVKNFVILAGLMFDVKLNNNHIIMDSTKLHTKKVIRYKYKSVANQKILLTLRDLHHL